jgi:hypothetical protein
MLISDALKQALEYFNRKLTESGDLMVKVSVSQPMDHGSEPYLGHDHVSFYDTSTGWFQEAGSKVIYISCKYHFQNRASINKFKPRKLTSYYVRFSFFHFLFGFKSLCYSHLILIFFS